VGDQVRDQVWNQARDQVYKCAYGSHDSEWLGFYEFFLNELKIKDAEKLIPQMRLAEQVGWWWPFNGAVVFSEKPIEIHRNDRNQLHNFNGSSLKYADGFSLYRFNRVRVTEELSKKESFSKDEILNEKNADIRREIIRKIGIEKAMEIMEAKVIDKMNDYELLSLDIGDKRGRPYLKMKNPSMDLVHIEGVPAEIKTVEDALKWRNNIESYQAPEVIS
jgi:hypothetical protein